MNDVSIAAVGTVCLDEIRRPGEKPQFGFGGLFYTVITLCQLAGDRGAVYPVCTIGERDYPGIAEQFERYPSVRFDRIRKCPGRNNTVVLDYYSSDERTEYSRNLPPAFTVRNLVPPPDTQACLVNFVSGREMRYRTFRALRRRLKIPLFVDLHSIFMGFGRNGRRFYRKNRDWSRWHESGDVVQMNRAEAGILAGRQLRTAADYAAFCRYLLDRGAVAAIITRGGDGSTVAWRAGKQRRCREIPAYDFGQAQEPTGCGDVYAAAFLWRWLQGGEPPEAADFAARVAGVRAAHAGSGSLHRLRELLHENRILE